MTICDSKQFLFCVVIQFECKLTIAGKKSHIDKDTKKKLATISVQENEMKKKNELFT